MDSESSDEVLKLLTRAGAGDPAAAEALLPQVYEALRALARRHMSREPAGHTLQPTALVNEAYLRLLGAQETTWNHRGHFFGAAARAMRQILVERARRRARLRHGGGRRRVELDDESDPAVDPFDRVDLIALDEALDELQQRDGRAADIVMLRYFAGLSVEDAARALGLSERTVRREWSYARLWLYERMTGGKGDDETA